MFRDCVRRRLEWTLVPGVMWVNGLNEFLWCAEGVHGKNMVGSVTKGMLMQRKVKFSVSLVWTEMSLHTCGSLNR